MNTSLLEDKPEYIDILKEIIELEEEKAPMEDSILEGKDADVRWDHKEVTTNASRLYHLESNGFLKRVYDSNKYTDYALVDREETKKVVKNIEDSTPPEVTKEGYEEVMHEFPSKEELPDYLFDDVIGYEDVKWLLKRGITSDKRVNFLLVGPPGSAKTVFLRCINKYLDGAVFIPATDASAPGFLEVMFETKPKYIMFDELDDMDSKHQKSLSSYTETGIVQETKSGKTRGFKTNTKTFASANSESDILSHITDRFVTLNFDAYTLEEFIEICIHLLPKEEDVTEQEAKRIAELVYRKEMSGDVRQAIGIARLSDGDPEKVFEILDKYSTKEVLGLSY